MMETEVKKILLIGRSGRGKSTLANVLLNKDDKFKEVFKESDGSISQTRNIQSETFEQEFIEQEEIKKINYRIIDTPGIGDTKLSKEEILDIIGEAVYLVRGGVNRVFFVTDGRFDKYETTAYDLLRKAIFDDKITNHTTIVRTKFRAFKNVEECQKDINEIEKSSDELKEIIKSCRNNIVHVDNPSMEIKGVIEEEAKQEIELNKNKRNESKKILLNHLKEVYQKAPYNPQGLEDLSKKVYERIEKKKRLRKALEKLEKQLKRVEEKIKNENLSKAIKDLNEEIEKESKAIHQTIFEHIQSKVGNNKIKELSENSEELSISRKKLSKPKATLSEFNFAFKLPGISFKAEYQRKKNFWEKEENLDEESVSGVNKSEKDAKLSDEIGEIITNLTKEEKWVEKSELIEDIAQKIKKVIEEYFKCLQIRNVLLIGGAENGKSALANVLLSKNGNFEEIFKENHWGLSKTKNIQSEEVEINGIWYRMVDNVVIDDSTSLSSDKIIQEITEVAYEMQGGINQVFFVFKDWISEEQIKIFNILKDFVFETHTAKLATLVRTNFEHFENQQACEEEWGNLLAQNQELSGIINSCNGVIYVNNPPAIEEENDEETGKGKEKKISKSKKEREASKEILLNHLVKNCLEIYKLERGGKAGIDVGLSGLLGLNAMIEHSKNSSDEKKIKVKIISTEGIISAGIEYQRTTNSSSGIKEESIKVGVGVIVNNKEKMAGIRIELLPRKKLLQIQTSPKQEVQQIWTNLHSSFTFELIYQWQFYNFTPSQIQDWLNIGLQPTDYEFVAWLRDIVKLAPEQVLNEGSEVELRELFQIYKIQEQQQTQIEWPPK